ncbi:MAG TPA: hypothetical protein VGL77_00460 [Armatimonadota bacterium]|jgi:hypothetical protein
MLRRSLPILLIISGISLAWAATARPRSFALQAKSAVALPATVVTAESGSLQKSGQHLTVSFAQNVRLTSAEQRSTLLCQNMVAEGTQQAPNSIKASGGVKFSMYVQRVEQGQTVEYRIDVNAQSATSVKENNGQVIHLKGGASVPRPRLTIVPLSTGHQKQAILIADAIDYYADVANADPKTVTQTATFVKAIGDAVFTSVTEAPAQGKAGASSRSAMYKLMGSAPLISGVFERNTETKDEFSQAFRFERGTAGVGARPHLEKSDVDPASPEVTKMDADFIICFPNAMQKDSTPDSSNAAPALVMRATGNVKVAATTTKQTTTVATTAKSPSARPAFGGVSSLPMHQSWLGEADKMEYWLERATAPADLKKFNHVVRMGYQHTLLPHVTMKDRDTGRVVTDLTGETLFMNLDTGEWGLLSNDQPTATGQGGHA